MVGAPACYTLGLVQSAARCVLNPSSKAIFGYADVVKLVDTLS